ncbi:ABC transporter periplasmic component [Microtetraspora sp. NBRC 13810]|uniref:ABC transporter substrate-binding protein n=1 Tax=Microtetraspora sp. NBRC 13810 TaxID=3030990 RepID=UPI0024A1BF8E|nr:iron-siderophore ABC transporter substrate-binding protein [Microtetraspora sp. NBRC 13810]GLW06067.1 ABC transporter periplasmic component [Microtetraspora sp. NBRC 13810]
MRALRALVLGVAAVVLSTGLAACGSSEPAPAAGPATASPAAGGAAFPRTVKHAMGETTVPAEPKRIVALDQSFVDAALALGANVVGFSTYRSIHEALPEYLGPDLAQYGKEATSVGTLEAPSLEQIIALKPDLILSAKVRHEALYDKLAQIAPTVFSETTGAIWKDNLRLVGQAIGKEDLAEQKIKEYQDRAAKIGQEIKDKNGGKLPTISVVRFAGEPTVRLYVENSYSGLVLKDVGFPRPEGQPTTTETIAVDVSQENIAQLDADEIFVSTYGDPSSEAPKAKFVSNPLWDRLKGEKRDVSDITWMTACGILGAQSMLDDIAGFFQVDPAKAA